MGSQTLEAVHRAWRAAVWVVLEVRALVLRALVRPDLPARRGLALGHQDRASGHLAREERDQRARPELQIRTHRRRIRFRLVSLLMGESQASA